MMTLDEIVETLYRENLEEVSRDLSMNYQQIWRLKAGKDTNPTYKTIKKLSDYFEVKNS